MDSNKFSPPSWIQGTWRSLFSIIIFQITSDDIIMTNGDTIIDFQESAKSYDVNEDISTTKYKITIIKSSGNSYFEFNKISSTSVYFTVTSGGITSDPIILYKD
jgi:hypothetical protein